MSPRVAFVHDALPFYGGAERTLEAMLEVFPASPIFTLMYAPEKFTGTLIGEADVRTSGLNRLPGIRKNHYRYFPLFPSAVRAFDLSTYDLIISSHYAVAHWVRTRSEQLHFSYVHTPMRYAWQHGDAMLERVPHPIRPALRHLQGRFRVNDQASAARVDHFAANSRFVAGLIEKAYRRKADVIYPPVAIGRFNHAGADRRGFICVSRLARHKRLEIVIRAFNLLGLPLTVIGEGPELARLQGIAKDNIVFTGRLCDEAVADHLSTSQAFVHMAAEDFGIAIVEAQAAGCPVIAFKGGANSETVRDGETGMLVPEQTPESLIRTVQDFLEKQEGFSVTDIIANAHTFARQRFIDQFKVAVEALF